MIGYSVRSNKDYTFWLDDWVDHGFCGGLDAGESHEWETIFVKEDEPHVDECQRCGLRRITDETEVIPRKVTIVLDPADS